MPAHLTGQCQTTPAPGPGWSERVLELFAYQDQWQGEVARPLLVSKETQCTQEDSPRC